MIIKEVIGIYFRKEILFWGWGEIGVNYRGKFWVSRGRGKIFSKS